MKRLIIMMMFVLAFVFALNAQPVQATPILTLSDGTTTITITDNGANDSNLAIGEITYIGSIGVWKTNITTGMTIGSSTSPEMDLCSVNLSSSSGGTLSIWFSDSGFTYSGGMEGEVGGTTSGTVSFESWTDYTQASAQQIGSTLAFSTSPFSGATSGNVVLTSGDTLDLVASITHTGAGITSFNYLVSVPEPGTLLLLGTGLIGIGVYRWRRMRK